MPGRKPVDVSRRLPLSADCRNVFDEICHGYTLLGRDSRALVTGKHRLRLLSCQIASSKQLAGCCMCSLSDQCENPYNAKPCMRTDNSACNWASSEWRIFNRLMVLSEESRQPTAMQGDIHGLPDWLVPLGHYSLRCRQQAYERIAAGDSAEQARPALQKCDAFARSIHVGSLGTETSVQPVVLGKVCHRHALYLFWLVERKYAGAEH
jgi:hypothetical protein